MSLSSKSLKPSPGHVSHRSHKAKQRPVKGKSQDAKLNSTELPNPIEEIEKRGTRRAAKLLLALGAEQAAEILRKLEPEEIELLMREMTQIEYVDDAETKSILADFKQTVGREKLHLKGGVEETRKFLENSLGPQMCEQIMRKINHRDLYVDFAFLEGIEPQALASVLSQEHSQITAVALSYLTPKVAAETMRHLPESFRSEVAMRIAKAAKIHPEALERVARILRERFEKRISESYSETGGAQSLAQILNYMEREEESQILASMEKERPDIMEKVKEHLYAFEELLILTQKETRILLSKLDDDAIIAKALRGAHQDIRLHFFNAMSQNRAADIMDDIERQGPLPLREIHEARFALLQLAQKLDEEGAITIKKAKEEYI